MSTGESEALLSRFLDFLQRDRRVRLGIGFVLIAALLFLLGRSVVNLIPRKYVIRLSGGPIVNNRHYIARILQKEAPRYGLAIEVKPEPGALAVLEKVSEGTIDMAFVQGGFEKRYPDVEHVATLMPEYMHLLARRQFKALGELKGRTINTGTKQSGSREIALKLLRFAGLVPGVDFVEQNLSAEELLALPERKMPDAIFTVSSVPSFLADTIVAEHGYDLLEIPFPQSLALRYGWAGNGKILAYTYGVTPAVPGRDVSTVTVSMYLIANARTDPEAVARLLETLFAPTVQNQLNMTLDEKDITSAASGYPVSAGTTQFLARNESAFTMETWNQLTGVFGLVMSFGGVFIVLFRWFRGAGPKPVQHDAEFHAYIAELVATEQAATMMEATGWVDRDKVRVMRKRVADLRALMLERCALVNLKDPHLYDRCSTAARATYDRLSQLIDPKVAL